MFAFELFIDRNLKTVKKRERWQDFCRLVPIMTLPKWVTAKESCPIRRPNDPD